jgi:hypothetical protein
MARLALIGQGGSGAREMTVNVRVRVRHLLRAPEAMARIRKRAEDLQAQYSLLIQSTHVEWGRTMSLLRVNAFGHAFTATIETTNRFAMMQIEIPDSMNPFADRLAGFVRRELRLTLSDATAGLQPPVR